MLVDAWEIRNAIALGEKDVLRKQLDETNKQIEGLLDRIVEATNASVVSAYETRIDKLERDRIVLQEKIENAVPEKGRLEDCMELAMRFLSSSWNIYKNGDYALRQTVLRLAFAKPLRYSLNGVHGTPEFFLPIQILRRNFWVKKRDGAAGEN